MRLEFVGTGRSSRKATATVVTLQLTKNLWRKQAEHGTSR